MIPISPTQILPHDVLAHIFSESINQNRISYNRFNILLLETIAALSHEWQAWVLNPNNSIINALKIDNIQLMLQKPRFSKSVRCFYGIINQKLIARGEKWFTYINLIEEGKEASAPLDIDPNICNFKNKTLFNFVIPILLKDQSKYEFLVEDLVKAGATAASFTKAIPSIFSIWIWEINEFHFKLADEFISKIISLSGNNVKPSSILQPFVGQIMCANVQNYEIMHQWFKAKGCIYTPEDLAYWLTHTPVRDYSQNFLEIFCHALDSPGFKVDAPLKCGNHLIHLTTKFCQKNEITPWFSQKKNDFLPIILQKAPHEINCKSEKELNLLSYLMIEPSLIPCIKSFIDEDWLFDQQENCHTGIINRLIKPRSAFDFNLNKLSHYLIAYYLQQIKNLFDDEKAFKSWLLKPYEDSLLHKIAFWSPEFIILLLEKNLISEKDCELINFDGQTVNNIAEQQKKLFSALYCKWERHAFEQNSIDDVAYINFMKEMPIDSEKKFIFHLLEESIHGYGDTTKQRMLIDRLLQCCGSDITDNEGNTLLHIAITSILSHDDNPNFEVVREIVAFLIDRGVNPHKKNKKGKSALDLAKKYNIKNINEIL